MAEVFRLVHAWKEESFGVAQPPREVASRMMFPQLEENASIPEMSTGYDGVMIVVYTCMTYMTIDKLLFRYIHDCT